ncbi:hypothetical protein [Allocoleopsis franciscana]|uniref:Uncharacterized protein n=1 Tax=Allocoleopsis franciscana PCC 7113 TaxID=1173027 RepID=K9WRW4_9CYAN|nr:hypothetical protein [Allocoleopsis franciscana]AFZ22297.1 hypothetical protein Mic7113_6735 [Allocoleopsis franciscana PCC 7113]
MSKFSGDTTTAATGNEASNENSSKSKESNDFYDIIGRIIAMGVRVIGVIPYAIATVFDNFIGQDKPGIKVLGGILLIGGVVLSADAFFQMFGGKPLFPFFEEPGSWIGIGWLWVWTKVNFWAAVVVSIAVMWIESYAIRGKNLGQARRDYESIKHHTVPEKNKATVDLVEVRRKEYKRAGMNERSVLGLFILFVVIMDICSAFVSRNPLGQPPLILLGMVVYNACTILAGEVGYALWRRANGEN